MKFATDGSITKQPIVDRLTHKGLRLVPNQETLVETLLLIDRSPKNAQESDYASFSPLELSLYVATACIFLALVPKRFP